MKKFFLNGLSENYLTKINNRIKPQSDVYIIGWRPDSNLWAYDFFTSINCNITLIEIFEKNAFAFPKNKYKNIKVVCDDVQNYEKYLSNSKNKILYWGEGPEHLPMNISKKLINRMKTDFDLIIVHTPFGEYIQEEMYGNIYERHLSTWYENDYKDLEFNYSLFHGPKNNFDAIIGFYHKENE